MARIPLLGGAYSTRAVIASAQRCINLYPEINPEGSPTPFTYYQRPGLRPLVQANPPAPVRGLYQASNGAGYAVVGQNVYAINPNWTLNLLGQLAVPRANPVSMIDNGQTLVIADASSLGYTVSLASGAFAQINDPTGTFTGATKLDYIDTFVLWNIPGTTAFGSTLSNQIGFDPLYVAGKTDYPDPLVTLLVNRHEILMFGRLKSEIWYDAGNAQFPFAELPGAYIEHGCVAPYSAASSDISAFWLAQDLQGQGVVFRQRGYDTTRISNHALEYAIRKMAKAGGTIADAIGYTYQIDGHTFYVLTFPSGDQTWVFDDSIGKPEFAWHQRAWMDPQGALHRDRTNCHAFINGLHVVGDWANGWLYELDPDTYTDNGSAIQFIRTFPHTLAGQASWGPSHIPIPSDGRRTRTDMFLADIQCGLVPLDATGAPAQCGLRVSRDRGRTWTDLPKQTLGVPGDYDLWPVWRTLGISRDMVFELSYSVAGEAPLNGAWYDAEILAK